MAVQDRLDDILQARPLPDDLIAPGHLPAKRLRRLIRYPDFRQKAARIELGKHAGVDWTCLVKLESSSEGKRSI